MVRYSACKQWIFFAPHFHLVLTLLLFLLLYKLVNNCWYFSADLYYRLIFHDSSNVDTTLWTDVLYLPVFCSSGFQVLSNILNVLYIYKIHLMATAAIVMLPNPTISQSSLSEGNVQRCHARNITGLSDSEISDHTKCLFISKRENVWLLSSSSMFVSW